MKRIFGGLLLGAALFVVAGAASALPPKSQSVKYFDESGNLVGQQYRLCSGISAHGGNVHTAYTITEETSCNGTPLSDEWIIPGKIVTGYVLPATTNITSACNIAHCEGDYVPEVQNLGLWPYTPGWQ